jgi:plastocyanin
VVLPRQIKVKAGGVVDFTVAGFHDIVIFKQGTYLVICNVRPHLLDGMLAYVKVN